MKKSFFMMLALLTVVSMVIGACGATTAPTVAPTAVVAQPTAVPATKVPPTAVPPAPIALTQFVGDIDGDNDIDAVDFGFLQRCWSGSGAAQRTPGCELARLDGDLDVDLNDLSRLISCSNGPRISPPDNCRR